MRLFQSGWNPSRLKNVSAEMSLSVLAYNLKRTIGLVGVNPILVAIRP